MARPYSAGGVSIAQSNPTCRRPAAVAACGLQETAGLPSPNVPGDFLFVSFRESHRIEGKERGRGREDWTLGVLSPAFAGSAFNLIPT